MANTSGSLSRERRDRLSIRSPRNTRNISLFVSFVPTKSVSCVSWLRGGLAWRELEHTHAFRLDELAQFFGGAGQRRECPVVHRHDLLHAEQLARLGRLLRSHRVEV